LKVDGLDERSHMLAASGRFAAMDANVTALERAFQLARSGAMAGIPDIRARLKREGYDQGAIEGPSLVRQLKNLIKSARPESVDASRT
jgi:hypothetical protein